MRLLYHITTLALSLLLAASASIGQYYFKQYQVDDGLVHNTVASIIQDRKGLIWIGTRDGLNRFDGYTFKIRKFRK
jgi:ligand-binding sensor domain-containing protein